MRTLQQQEIREQETQQHGAGWSASMAIAALAVAAALVVREIAGAVGVDVQVTSGGTTHGVGLGAVAIGSGVSAVMGVLVLQAALRKLERGRRWWTIGAVVALVLSLTSPLQATTASGWLVLTLLHLVTAAVVILGLRRVSR